jgi:hypothetical protein
MPKPELTAEEQARLRGDIIDEDNPPGDLEGDSDEDVNVELSGEDSDNPDTDEDRDEPGGEADDEESEADDESGDSLEGSDEEKPAITIPKARFDDAQHKARERQLALEQQVKELEANQHKEVVSADLTKMAEELEQLNVQYEDFLMDGELEKARAVRQDRDKKQNAIIDLRLNTQSQAAGSAAVEQMRFDAQLAQFEAKFPAINPDSDSFNQEIVTEVNEMLEIFKNSGYTLAASLNKAIHYVIRDDETRKGDDGDAVRNKRSKTARKRVAKAVKKSPPALHNKGKDSDKSGSNDGLPDVTKMSIEQFDAMSEADLKIARGDQLSDEEAAA